MSQRSTLDEWYIHSIANYSLLSDSSKKHTCLQLKDYNCFSKV